MALMGRTRHSRGHLGAGAAVLACILLSWLILLIGIAACQKQVLVSHALEFEWWIICFEFILVILAATHLMGYHTGHAGVVALKAVNTVFCMLYAHLYNQYRQGARSTDLDGGITADLDGVTEKRVKTALAGFVLLSISNMLLLAVLGTAPTATNTYNNREVTSTRGAQMTPRTQPTAAYPTTAAAPASAGMGMGQTGVAGAGQTVV